MTKLVMDSRWVHYVEGDEGDLKLVENPACPWAGG